jgi:hypothetical protein
VMEMRIKVLIGFTIFMLLASILMIADMLT